MKSWVKSLLIGLSITVISLCFLLLFLPSLLKPTLNRWLPDILAAAGIENGSISISQFSWQALRINELSLPLADGSYIALNDFSLRYSPRQLILNGRLKTLDIHKVTLHLAGDSGKEIAGAAAVGAQHAADEALNENPIVEIPAFKQWLSLPLDSVTINQLELQHPSIAANLQAKITPQLWRIWGDTQLDNVPLPWQLEMQFQDGGDLLVLLSESRELLTQVHANIEQDEQGNTRIQLQNTLNLEAFAERLLLDLADQSPLTQASIHADIQLPQQLQIPQGISVSSVIKLATKQQTLLNQPQQSLHWQSGELALNIDKEQDQPLNFKLLSQHQLRGSFDQHGFTLRQNTSTEMPLLQGQCDSVFSQCQLGGLLPWFINAKQQTAHLSLSPQINWDKTQGVTGTLAVNFSANQNNKKWPAATVSSKGQFNLEADTAGNWQVSSDNGINNRITLAEINLPQTPVEEQDARLKKQPLQSVVLTPLTIDLLPQLSVKNQNGKFSFQPLIARLNEFNARLNQTQVQRKNRLKKNEVASFDIGNNEIQCLPDISVNKARQQITTQCQLDLSLLPSRYGEWPTPSVNVSGPIEILSTQATNNGDKNTATKALESDQKELSISADIRLTASDEVVSLRTHFEHQQNARGQHGSAQWHLDDIPLSWDSLQLSEMVTLTQMQLLDGTISGQGWLDWQLNGDQWQIKPDFMLRADNVSTLYDNSISLEKWRALFALRRPYDISADQLGDYFIDAQISGDTLNSGIELSNILARSQTRLPADFSSALIEIYEMHTNLLGGRVHTPLIRFDTTKDINAFGIELDNIQISELAKLEPNAEVEATGVLDGVLPIVLTAQGPSVPGGTLFARQPGGVIQYNNETSQALKASDQTVGLALQLLENFQYSQLESGVEYQPDGNLDLALQFQGKNPDFFGGQATHLNVNLNYNLLDLLESLRITNDLIQKVEDKYQL